MTRPFEGYLICKNCGHLVKKNDDDADWPWIHIIGWVPCVPMFTGSTKAEPY